MKIRLIFVILTALVTLSACRGGDNEAPPQAETDGRIILGFSQLGDESEWRTSSSNDIRRAAAQSGIQLIFENAQQKQFNQIKAIRSFILNRVDVIAFSPIVEEGWDNILMDAKAAGIPVILVDRYIKTEEDGLYSAFIGSDFEQEGFEAGKWIVRRFIREEAPVKVVEISGTPNSSPTIGRSEGIRSAFGYSDKFQIVQSVSGDFMRSKGRECMETILRETPEFNVLFAHNDDMALGAIEILEERGIRPGKDVVIVSVDAQRSGVLALKEGKINCLVECSPYIGDALMDVAKRISRGESVPLNTYSYEGVFTENNLDDLPVRP